MSTPHQASSDAASTAREHTHEYTLCIIKPDAVANKHTDAIEQLLHANDLIPVARKRMILSKEQAEIFYAVHSQRPFFQDLVRFMTEGEVCMMVLKGPKAINRYRDLMGATNPKEALPGTIRHAYGESIDRNAVHGSDSASNANHEIKLCFGALEIQCGDYCRIAL